MTMKRKMRLGCFFSFQFLDTKDLNALKQHFVMEFTDVQTINLNAQTTHLDVILTNKENLQLLERKNIELHDKCFLLLKKDQSILRPTDFNFKNSINMLYQSDNWVANLMHYIKHNNNVLSPTLNTINTDRERTPFLGKLNTVIIKNCKKGDCTSIDVIAKTMETCPVELRHTVKSITGMTAVQYILYYRLKIAYKLLQNSDYNAQETALGTGFSSYSYFSRVFKNTFGVAPSKIKKVELAVV